MVAWSAASTSFRAALRSSGKIAGRGASAYYWPCDIAAKLRHQVLELAGTPAAGVVEEHQGLAVGLERVYLLRVIVDVAVGKAQVGPAVVVEIQPLRTETERLVCRPRNADFRARVLERSRAGITIDLIAFVGEAGYRQVQLAVAIVVGPIRAHRRERVTRYLAESRSHRLSHVSKPHVSKVSHEIGGRTIVADVEVHPIVAIEIGEGYHQGLSIRVRHSGRGGDVPESAVAGVPPDLAEFRAIAAGRTPALYAGDELAILRLPGPEDDVIEEHEIEPAVSVQIHKARAASPVAVVL